MSEVKLVRLTSGEEIIAKVEQIDDGFVLNKPAVLIPAGKDQLAFGQWLPYADITDGVEIPSEFIVFIVDPMVDLLNQYSASFGSGIVIPPTGAISGADGLKLTT
jgi:hypothetical protein